MGFDHTIMKWIQALGGSDGSTWQKIMDFFFAASTFLCEELFLLIAIFIIFWGVNKKMGEFLVFSLFASIGVNGFIKAIIARPRPFLNPEFSDLRYVQLDNFFVNTTGLNTSYSFPSGHSQLAGALFGSFALFVRKRWATILMTILILLVMISRTYLGVHYPTDILVGGAIGVGIAFAMAYILKKFPEKKMLILLILFLVVVLSLIVEIATDAVSIGGTVKMLGLAGGAIGGYYWDSKKIHFSVDGVWWKRTLRVIIGFGLIMGIRLGLKPLFGLFIGDSQSLEHLFDGIRYLIVGFVATGLWPYIFMKIKL